MARWSKAAIFLLSACGAEGALARVGFRPKSSTDATAVAVGGARGGEFCLLLGVTREATLPSTKRRLLMPLGELVDNLACKRITVVTTRCLAVETTPKSYLFFIHH